MKRPDFVTKNGPIEIHQIPTRTDNYVYFFRDEAQNFTAVFDPSDAPPVFAYCDAHNWQLNAILITHHHPDHVDGNLQLQEKFKCPIFALKDDSPRIPGVTNFWSKESQEWLMGHHYKILFTPGHTLGHICLHFSDLKFLFCGDTLFSFGCGRLFEGSPEMMLSSLKKIRRLPKDTTFFCSHEYTLSNLEFALSLEPDSDRLKETYMELKVLRKSNTPTVPALLAREIEMNPFLRWDDPVLKKALNMENASDLEVFTFVRTQRNKW